MTKPELIDHCVLTFAEIRKFAKDVEYNKELVIGNLQTMLFIFDPQQTRKGSHKRFYNFVTDENGVRLNEKTLVVAAS